MLQRYFHDTIYIVILTTQLCFNEKKILSLGSNLSGRNVYPSFMIIIAAIFINNFLWNYNEIVCLQYEECERIKKVIWRDHTVRKVSKNCIWISNDISYCICFLLLLIWRQHITPPPYNAFHIILCSLSMNWTSFLHSIIYKIWPLMPHGEFQPTQLFTINFKLHVVNIKHFVQNSIQF